MTRVHQALSGVGPYDAVSVQAFAWQRLLRGWDMEGGVYGVGVDPRVRGAHKLRRLDPAPDDLVVLRYSAYAPELRRVLEMPCRKLLVYHNVTPPRYFWSFHPGVAVACALGRSQLPRYAAAADHAVADSAYNAAELSESGVADPGVVPILLEPERLRPRGESGQRDPSAPLILSVARLVPSKRHDLVFAAFAAYQRAHAHGARLMVVGEPLSPAYRRRVEELAAASGARNVEIAGGLAQEQLNAAFAEAGALLSMSEHEGFSVPLLEAFTFGLPVVARPAGAMPEVGGDAVLWAPEEPDAAVAAELIHAAVRDEALRAELAERGRARLEAFAPERTVEKVRAAVEAALAR